MCVCACVSTLHERVRPPLTYTYSLRPTNLQVMLPFADMMVSAENLTTCKVLLSLHRACESIDLITIITVFEKVPWHTKQREDALWSSKTWPY